MPLPAEKGLKLQMRKRIRNRHIDLMPLPAEKGLKLETEPATYTIYHGFDAPSSRKRIETARNQTAFRLRVDLMPLPAEKGLKHQQTQLFKLLR